MPTHTTRTFPATAIPLLEVSSAARCLASGGLLLFPTETYYALGCLASAAQAVDMVYQVKARQTSHPLPLVAGSVEQVSSMCHIAHIPAPLLDFWPGPLTLLLPCKKGALLPDRLVNGEGLVAIRVSSHPLVAQLCQVAGRPLTASSANISGQPPARLADELAPPLVEALAKAPVASGFLAPASPGETPAGGAPSTIVRPLPNGQLAVLRQGAVSLNALQAAGFACVV